MVKIRDVLNHFNLDIIINKESDWGNELVLDCEIEIEGMYDSFKNKKRKFDGKKIDEYIFIKKMDYGYKELIIRPDDEKFTIQDLTHIKGKSIVSGVVYDNYGIGRMVN